VDARDEVGKTFWKSDSALLFVLWIIVEVTAVAIHDKYDELSVIHKVLYVGPR
jgi:hypothetical protein